MQLQAVSDGGGILRQRPGRPCARKTVSESAKNGGASCLLLVLVYVGLECLGENNN